MRKKFLAMYALVGALVASPIFTSCIDSEESASVTQVRSERAAQIKAAAEMQKAMDELNLALKQVKLESEKATLEETKAKAEQAVLTAQLEILKKQIELDNYNDTRLSGLSSAYTTALNSVLTLNKQLYKANVELTAMQEGLVTAQEFVASETARLNAEIAAQKAVLETLNKGEGIDKEAIVAQLNDLYAQLDVAETEKSKLEAEYGSLDAYQGVNHFGNIYKMVDAEDEDGSPLYVQLNGTIGTASTATITNDNGTPDDDSDDTEETVNLEKHQVPATDENGNDIVLHYGLDHYYNNNPTKLATIEAARKLHRLSVNTVYSLLTNDVNGYLILEEGQIAEFKKYAVSNYPNAIKDLKAELGTEADKDDATYEKEVEEGVITELPTLYAKLAIANKALADANALPETTDAEKATKKTAVENAEIAVAYAKDFINDKMVDIADYEKNNEAMLAFDSYVAAFSGADYDAYKAAKDAIDANSELWNSLDAEIWAIRNTYISHANIGNDSYIQEWVFKSDFNFDEEVAKLENEIKVNEAALENIETTLNISGDNTAGISGSKFTEAEIEALIAWKKEAIAILETQLELKQAEADNAKAALDAYLATEEEA